MRNKWSKLIKPDDEGSAIQTYEMVEFPSQCDVSQHDNDGDGTEEENAEPLHDCSLLQQEAYEAGRLAGVDEGKSLVRVETDAQMQQALDLAAQVGLERASLIQQVEEDIVRLAVAIAAKVIHAEVSVEPNIVREQVHRALEVLSSQSLVRIRVCPQDADYLESVRSTLTDHSGEPLPIKIERDAAIQAGGCVVDSEALSIDATIERQLERIEEGLVSRG